MAAARSTRRVALFLVLLAGAAAVLWQRRAARSVGAVGVPSWPPFQPEHVIVVPEPAGQTVPSAAAPPVVAQSAVAQRWVTPVDGACPDGYTIKANDNSRIFHLPGGRFYARTAPERCYASADDAVADGYRQAKA